MPKPLPRIRYVVGWSCRALPPCCLVMPSIGVVYPGLAMFPL